RIGCLRRRWNDRRCDVLRRRCRVNTRDFRVGSQLSYARYAWCRRSGLHGLRWSNRISSRKRNDLQGPFGMAAICDQSPAAMQFRIDHNARQTIETSRPTMEARIRMKLIPDFLPEHEPFNALKICQF